METLQHETRRVVDVPLILHEAMLIKDRYQAKQIQL